MSQRDRLYARFKQSGNVFDWIKYKSARNHCVSVIRNAKRSFFIKSAEDGVKKFWKNIKLCSGLGKTKNTSLPWPHSNSFISKQSANAINSNFIASVNSLCKSSNSSDSRTSPSCDNCNRNILTDNTQRYRFRHVSATDVLSAIQNIARKNVCGIDGISIKMLSLSASEIAPALAAIFNHSIDKGIFPSQWKMATITVVYKKGSVLDFSSYRPISVLSTVSKIFEKVILSQLRDIIDSNHLLSDQQHGFQPNRSCETALISLVSRIVRARDDKQYSAMAALDFSRAFDCLNHDILLKCLGSIGFDNVTVKWFASYLHGRQQSVKYNGILSDMLDVEHGVPQGSLLGPILFNFYLNDLLVQLPSNLSLAYADDLTVLATGTTIHDTIISLQKTIDFITTWADSHRLFLNPGKSKWMLIAPPHRTLNHNDVLTLSRQAVAQVDKLTILGVIISNDLCWSHHIRSVCGKVLSRLQAITRFGRTLNCNTRRIAFNAFVRPHLTYCLPIWGSTTDSVSNDMNRTLLKCLQTVTHNNKAIFTENSFTQYGLCKFEHLVLFRSMLAFYKYVNGDFYDGLNLKMNSSQYNTRASCSNKFVPHVFNFKCSDHSFLASSIKHWNSLPNSVTAITNFSLFKKKLFDYICVMTK